MPTSIRNGVQGEETMLLEDLLALPVGTMVIGEVQKLSTLPGVVASHPDGSHFIRWDDGYSSIPLGRERAYDEYIAAHTQLQIQCAAAATGETRNDNRGERRESPTNTSRVRST